MVAQEKSGHLKSANDIFRCDDLPLTLRTRLVGLSREQSHKLYKIKDLKHEWNEWVKGYASNNRTIQTWYNKIFGFRTALHVFWREFLNHFGNNGLEHQLHSNHRSTLWKTRFIVRHFETKLKLIFQPYSTWIKSTSWDRTSSRFSREGQCWYYHPASTYSPRIYLVFIETLEAKIYLFQHLLFNVTCFSHPSSSWRSVFSSSPMDLPQLIFLISLWWRL